MSKEELHSSIVPPQGNWWKPVGAQEKKWVIIAFAWCMVLFFMMPFWHFKGGQNPSGIRSKVDPEKFRVRTDKFIKDYQIGEESGIPVVAPPPGSDIYLVGRMWSWYPVLKLQKGAEYVLHLSSMDVNHGFSLHPVNVNFQVIPGYDYGLKIVPKTVGDFKILCNEFCGIGHHLMIGKVIVEEGDSNE